ncbi:FAD-dependent oxidoreductase [Streptomyces sp. NPDC059092]|uniref:FAD-dependent oxidoreductase n=1 Tax=Streptomyces sp. NPDC059092 TaxID=3346725 RepID=UPI003691A674
MSSSDAGPGVSEDLAYPTLSQRQLVHLFDLGVVEDVTAGHVIHRIGDKTYDLVVIDDGEVEVVREATADAPEEVIATFGPGAFLGELGLLTGQTVFLSARAVRSSRIYRISAENFRNLMETEAEIADIILAAFRARRAILKYAAAQTIEIIGSSFSAESMSLRTYVARLELPHSWLDVDTSEAKFLMDVSALSVDDLPAVLLPGEKLVKATPAELATKLGLSYRKGRSADVDLVVVGGGPAGLAATVNGSSEGLATVMLDTVGPGGQAAASSRIENYLGFPQGLSGAELTRRASAQVLKFGANIYSPSTVVAIRTSGDRLTVLLSDGVEIPARAAIVATGARYRSLPIDRWNEFEHAGIYYAATEMEARSCARKEVAVVGGANSAGQAALFLAGRGCMVNLVVRGEDLSARMSSYLINRISVHPRIAVHASTEVTELQGGASLEAIRLTNSSHHEETVVSCCGLFCFIGAYPASGWLNGCCCTDGKGFICTGSHIPDENLGRQWEILGRDPLPFETSVPGIFAVGDVRYGSTKRVAAAVGEGASAISSVHQVIGARL